MDIKGFYSIFQEKWSAILLVGLFFGATSFIFLLSTEKKFVAEEDLLIVQNTSQTQDFYTLSRSNEYLNNVLSEAVYSEAFINEVENLGSLDGFFQTTDRRERINEWKKNVVINKNFQGTMLHVEVLHNSSSRAIQVARSIAQVLADSNDLFRSGTKGDVVVKVVSGPFVSGNPSGIQMVVFVLSGFFVGIVFGSLYFLIKQTLHPTRISLY